MENYTFYPGQKVVCVDSYSCHGDTELVVGAAYRVKAVSLSHCGYIVLDVGFENDIMSGSTRCDCGASYGAFVAWKKASRFRPLDTLTEQVERIEKEGAPLEPETA